MIAFINQFLSYFLLAIIMMVIIVAAVICGKKLRDIKDKKDSEKNEIIESSEE